MMLAKLVDPIGWTLIHFLWQGLLVGVLHELAVRLTARRSPGLRYMISLSALLALVAAPALTLAWLWPASGGALQHEVMSLPSITVDFHDGQGNSSWLPWIVMLWLAGVLLMSLRFGFGLYALKRLAAHADFDAVPEYMQQELSRLAGFMTVRRSVRLALSTRVSSPLVIGWLKPIILLPLSAATGLDHQQIRMVLAHELAHLRRYDNVVNLFQVIVETLLFYHPAVHRISRSLRQEREQCCDDMAATIGGNSFAYARVLAQLEEMRQFERRNAFALGIAEEELYVRIQRLVGVTPAATTKDRWLPLALFGMVAFIAFRPLPDISAPLLPDGLFASGTERARITLRLPPPVSRNFTPIQAAATDTPAVSSDAADANESSKTSSANTRESTRLPSSTREAPNSRNVAQELTEAASEQESAPVSKIMREPGEERQNARAQQRDVPVLTGGELLHAEAAAYPPRALRAGIEGEVKLAFTIAVDGQVTDVEIKDGSPRGVFDRAAEEAVKQWRYRPFMEDGEPVAKRVTQLMEFRLSPKPSRRGGTDGGSCREQTGTRLCRASNAETTLRIVND